MEEETFTKDIFNNNIDFFLHTQEKKINFFF